MAVAPTLEAKTSRRSPEIERQALHMYQDALRAIDARGSWRTHGDRLIARARIGELFLLFADILEEEGKFDFRAIRAAIGNVHETQDESERG